MSEQLFKNFTIDIQQKLYEKESAEGHIGVYQTAPFGILLTMNGQVVAAQHDGFFYYEMMVHPVLFTHPRPKTVAIIGNGFGILSEVLKHENVSKVVCINDNALLEDVLGRYFSYQKKPDARIEYCTAAPLVFLEQQKEAQFDVVIQNQQSGDFIPEHYRSYQRVLKTDGIVIQSCQSSLLHLNTLKPIFQNIQHAGFHDWQSLHFSQQSYPSGSRTLIMATKAAVFSRVREKDIYNRSFTTRYYNYDTHKAALALPEFIREELNHH